MTQARTIVIPLADPAQEQHGMAEQATTCARRLVGAGDARVLLLSAIEADTARDARQAYLDEIAATIDGEVETAIALGDPATAILAAAAQEATAGAVIVMASHGRRGAHLRRLGSVAATVARGAHCPVMIVPASPVTDAPVCTLIERVLLPINDIEMVSPFLTAAIAEMGVERSRQIAFHLVEVTTPAPPRPLVVEGERYIDSTEVPAHFLRRAAEALQERGFQATWDLRIGDPAREITRMAVERDINLIVMPAHSRHGFNSLVPGLFAALHEAGVTIPALLVHPAITPAEPGHAASRIERSSAD